MGKDVSFKKLAQKNPNRIVIASVALRNEQGLAKTFTVLRSVNTVSEMESALQYYEQEGFSDVMAIPILDEDNPEFEKFSPRYVAKMFRVFYHTDSN